MKNTNTNEVFELSDEIEAYLELRLMGFRHEYPEDHCIVQTAVRLREKVRAKARRMAAAAALAEAMHGLLEQATGPAAVYGDGRGRDGKKTGLSHWEFNKLRKTRIEQACAALAQWEGNA